MDFKVTVKGDPHLANEAFLNTNDSFAASNVAFMGTTSAVNGMMNVVGSMVNAVAEVVEHAFVPIDTRNKIWVTMNQPSYVGGDMISGTVEMDCLVPFFAKGVLVKFKGFERVWLQEHRLETEGEGSNKRTVQKTIDHKENKEFFRSTICVYPHQGNVNPGHYSFPFQYQLPPTLPGTFCEDGKDAQGHYSAKILYKVKATVDVAHRHDLKFTTRLIVNERCNELVKPSFAENRKSFMLTKGKLVAKAWLNKNAYFPGETLVNKLKINNTSVKPTRRISLKVHHRMELRAHLYHRTINHVVYKQEYPGINPCFYGKRYLPFNIPVDLKPSSTLGDHAKSSYTLEVEFDIPGAIDLSVNLPLTLFAPQFMYSAIPNQPPGAPLPPDVSYRHPWEDEDKVKNCRKCNTSFSLFNRKHHCRHCMKVFCGKCTEKQTPITKLAYPKPVKVCDDCYPVAMNGGVKYQSAKALAAAYQESVNQYYAQYTQQYPWLAQQQQPLQPAVAPQ
ncbi:FYVE-type zinc finger-containing protein [Heterostelium album PN500]|uniref:FYVE-type zinc finger-containing protein n=1 Tax=Heterostelium pallidum (strain ATCC 26659 / Pp 5 / PN500) TaxID=670386 RepID=D3BKB7_HETP5|nr:FYVE-type zinc finger-containing protein [Heterostelium album PN500]EFA78347.1 FYVE-type zinc finger-containing protein [Heterostelium album PN500]|eukprot:XP_020430472.1 FYVE-type zinc finger-containing protein [Heterostelium album PN500]